MSTTTIPDDVADQFAAIDKALSRAVACLALGLTRGMLEQLLHAQEMSASLNFRLESDRMAPGTAAPIAATAKAPAQEQAVLP